MAEERIEHGQNPETEFEQRDLSAKGIMSFLLGLAVFGVILHFVLAGMYDVLDRYEQRHQPPLSPLETPVEKHSRQVPADTLMKFPEPRLEVNERTELQGVVLAQEQRLNSYGWVDEKSGILHIPIERAMQLIAQNGLPTRGQGNGAVPAQAGKGQKINARARGR
ncbi:MAG TPA: hypothetical protein VFJ47_15335 [Terriglobales bacterium]|nr:hypothetical protein [Terriglobales bacterium]